MMYKLKIKKYRKAKHLTQKQLSKKVSISQNYLCELENNKYDIKISLLFRIGKELNVCPKKFIICNNCIKNKFK